MNLTVNGKPREISDGASGPVDVSSLLRALDINPKLVAVAINGDVIPKNSYDDTTVREGDVVEVVRMVGGGAR